MEKFTFEIEAKLDKATKSVEALTDSVEELKKAQQEQVEGLEKQVKDLEKQNAKTTKAVKGLAKGFKGVGLAMKAAGFGLIVAIFQKLGETLMANQKVADAVETVFAAIGIVFQQVSEAIFGVYERVSETNGGFDALKKVVGGVLTIALNNLLLVIQGLQLGFQYLKLAYENVFGDDEGVKQAQAEIDLLKDKAAETVERIAEAGKQVGQNIGEAVGEVGEFVSEAVEATAKAVQDIDQEAVLSSAQRLVAIKKNYALMEAASQRLIEKYDLEAETQRQIRDDVSLSIADRIKANEELGRVLQEQSDEEKKQIEIRIAAINEQIKLEGESHELTTQLYQLQTEMLAIDAKVAGFKSEQLTNEVGLKQELIDLTNSEKEGKTQLAIDQMKFNAELIDSETQKLEKKKEILEIERDLELTRLQEQIDNAAIGTQARIDAELAYAQAEQQFKQDGITLDNQIKEQKEADALAEKERLEAQAQLKKDLVQQGLDAVIGAAGAESKVGKALFIAKQALALKELVMNAKSTLSKATMNAAESGTDLAKGAGKAAASAPPPFNLIPIAMFAAQAVGIVSSIKKAMSKTKQATAAAGGGGGAGSVSAPTTTSTAAPRFNVVGASQTSQLAETIAGKEQKPIKAYVTSSDVTSAQSLDRNIVEEAGLG